MIDITGELTFIYPIEIKNGIFKNWINVSKVSFSIFEISGGVFESRIGIYDVEFKDGFQISGGCFKSWFSISNIESDSFEVLDGVFELWFLISKSKLNYIYILGGKFKDDFRIIQCFCKENMIIDNPTGYVNEFSFTRGLNFFTKINPNSNINVLNIPDIDKNGIIDINDVTINQLNINNCKNFGLITLTDIKFEARKIYKWNDETKEYELTENKQPSLIYINNSFIGNTKFQSVDFENADNIIIDNTDINDANIRGKYFPTSVKKVFSNNKRERKKARLADIYNDLANMMKRQGNKRMELNYTATYQQLLRQSLNPFTDFNDWFPLALGKVSSNNGTDWWNALLFTLGMPLLIFVPYTWAKGVYAFCSDCPFYESLLLGVQNYLEFAFPNIFKMSFDEPTLLALLLSILGKLVFAYGVYQFVLSFRRLGRR